MSQGRSRPRKPKPPTGSIPAGVAGMELEARREQRLKTVAFLKKDRTPLTVIAVAENSAAVAEAAIQQALHKSPPRPPLDCREGCAWCCHKVVGTTVPEVLRIAKFLRERLTQEDYQATQGRVIDRDERRRALKGEDRWAADHLPCPLLVEDRCTVYPVRPLTCRGFTSSDVHACEFAYRERARSIIPVYEPQLRLATFVLDGMRAGLTESGLSGERLELTAALRIALTVADAAQCWLSGEPVFASAKLP